MAEQMNIDIIATDRATPTLRRTRDEIDKVGQQARTTAAQTKNLSGGFGGMGRSAGQAGIQVQQLVGQVTSGVNPMVALSQQSADLGFVLGVPLLGAVVSIAAALGTVLLPRLFETEKGFADLRKEIDSVGLDINDMPAELLAANMKLLESNAKDAKDEFNDLSTQLQEAEKELVRIAQESQLNPFGGDFAAETENAQQKVDDLRKQVLQSNVAMLVAAERAKNFKDEINGTADALERMAREQDRVTQQMTDRMRLIFEGADSETKYRMEVDKLRKALENQNGEMTPDAIQAYQHHIEQLTKKYFPANKAIKDATDQFKLAEITMQEVESKGIRTIEDGLVDMATGAKSAKDAFKDMATSIIADIIRMNIRNAFTSSLSGASGGIFSSIFSGITGGMTGGTVPYQSTQQAFAVPNYRPPSFTPVSAEGGGYTGAGGRVGGIDGRGGFPAILHPNETVVDHTQGQGTGVNVTLNISTGVSQTVRSEIANLLPQITQATKAAVADARMRGGSFSKAMVGS